MYIYIYVHYIFIKEKQYKTTSSTNLHKTKSQDPVKKKYLENSLNNHIH